MTGSTKGRTGRVGAQADKPLSQRREVLQPGGTEVSPRWLEHSLTVALCLICAMRIAVHHSTCNGASSRSVFELPSASPRAAMVRPPLVSGIPKVPIRQVAGMSCFGQCRPQTGSPSCVITAYFLRNRVRTARSGKASHLLNSSRMKC